MQNFTWILSGAKCHRRLIGPCWGGGEKDCSGVKHLQIYTNFQLPKFDKTNSKFIWKFPWKAIQKVHLQEWLRTQMTGCQRPCSYLEYSFIGEKQQTAFASENYIFSLWAVSADTVGMVLSGRNRETWYRASQKKLVSELLNSIKGALLCWMFKFSNALLCWMIGRWWLWRFSMTNFVLPKNCQKMPKCENVKFWIPSQWHSDCVQNFWGRPKSKIGRPVPFWKFQILGCLWWRELLSRVG